MTQGDVKRVTYLSDKYKGADAFIAARKILEVTEVEVRKMEHSDLKLPLLVDNFNTNNLGTIAPFLSREPTHDTELEMVIILKSEPLVWATTPKRDLCSGQKRRSSDSRGYSFLAWPLI